jgi:hypothetical protein
MSPVATRVKVRTGTVVAGIPVVDDTPTVPPVVAPVVGAASIAVVAVGQGLHPGKIPGLWAIVCHFLQFHIKPDIRFV